MTDYCAIERTRRRMPASWLAEEHETASVWALGEQSAFHRALNQRLETHRGIAWRLAFAGYTARMINEWAQT